MTIQQASRRYGIPVGILREYERWSLGGRQSREGEEPEYDDADLERLSTIMALHDMGFTSKEAETYMRLLLEEQDGGAQRLRMLNRRRAAALEEIHFMERQLARLDSLRHRLLRGQGPQKG